MNLIKYNQYGKTGKHTFVLHGGPAAAGSAQPLAEELGQYCIAIEPYQRQAADQSLLTVKTHIEDLHNLILNICPNAKPNIVGHSWGAMLALSYASEHGACVDKITLIGCGTFDIKDRKQFHRRHKQLLTKQKQKELKQIQSITDLTNKNEKIAEFFDGLYAYDANSDLRPGVTFDFTSHTQTWNDMLAQQNANVYPHTFTNIKNEVIMLHGKQDPHPGRLTCESLQRYIPQLRYIEFDKCGHIPWQEKHAKENFYVALKEVLVSS